MKRSVRASRGEPGALAPSVTTASRRRWFVHASIGAFACALPALSAAGDPSAHQRIGRLFSGPEQRVELDRIRNDPDFGQHAGTVAASPGSDAGSDATPDAEHEVGRDAERGPPVRTLTLDGIVLRGDGHRVAWINGVEAAAGPVGPPGAGIAVTHAPGVQVHISLHESRVSTALKPGQTVDLMDGRVREAYERPSWKSAAAASGGEIPDPHSCDVEPRGAARPDTCMTGSRPPEPLAATGGVQHGPPGAVQPLLRRTRGLSGVPGQSALSHARVPPADAGSPGDGHGVR